MRGGFYKIFGWNAGGCDFESDNDTLNDDIEYQNGLDPLSNDTDSGQWDDYSEFRYWNYTCHLPASQAAEYCKNPDVDGDGIMDYQEVKGYTVRIITCWNETGAPLHSDREMYGDPLQAYKQSDGGWTDTDADRIPDIVEIYFSNTTNIDNETMWQEYLSNTTTGSLFQNYAWCREYYLDLQKNNTSLAENWTQKAFNPFVSYNLPPTIVKYSVTMSEFHFSWGDAVTISFWYLLRDVRGIGEIKMELVELGTNNVKWSRTKNPGMLTEYNMTEEVSIGLGTVFWGFELRIKVSNGFNEVSLKDDFKSVGSMMVEALQALAAMLVGGLQKAWEAVQNAVNAIFEFFKQLIQDALEKVLGPIISQVTNLYNQLLDVVSKGINHSSATTLANALGYIILGSNIFMLALAMVVSLQIIFTLVKATGIGSIVEMTAGLVMNIIISALISTIVYDLTYGPNALENVIPPEVNAGISTTFSLMDIILALGVWAASATREIKTAAKFVFVSLAVFITGLALELGRMIAHKDTTKMGYAKAIILDILACMLSVYAYLEIRPHSSLAKRYYPALGILDEAFGLISIAVSTTTLVCDINGFLRS